MAIELRFRAQPFAAEHTTASFLEDTLADPAFNRLTVAVAWARFRGLSRLRSDFESFRSRGGSLRIILGIDEGGATRPGLILAQQLFNEAYVLHDPEGGTFHPKVYLAEGQGQARLLVGSSNATPGGLYSNYEASLEARFTFPRDTNEQAIREVNHYIDELLAEREICLPLTEELIDRLVGSPRYLVAGHERTRRRGRRSEPSSDPDLDASGSTTDVQQEEVVFGQRQGPRTAPPPLPDSAMRELAELEAVEPDEDEAAEVAGEEVPEVEVAAAPVVVRTWDKELPAGDAQRTRPGTNPTGNLRLTKAGHDIDWTVWFREELFGPADWQATTDSRDNRIETATVLLTVTIDGRGLGTMPFKIDHAPHREAAQRNHTTVLHWGPLMAALRANDYSGFTLTIARLSNGTFTLDISP